MKHLRSSVFLLMALTFAACDPASISAPDEAGRTAEYSQQVETLLSTSDSEPGLLLRGISKDPTSATGDGVELLAGSFVVYEDGGAEGELLLRTQTGQDRYMFEQGRIECASDVPEAVLLVGTAFVFIQGEEPTTDAFEVRVAPASKDGDRDIDEIIAFAGTRGNVRVEAQVEGELVFGEGACPR